MKMFVGTIGLIFLIVSITLAQDVIDKTKQFDFLDSLALTADQIESGLLYLDTPPYANKIKNASGQVVLFKPLDQYKVLIAHPSAGVRAVNYTVINLYCEQKNRGK